MICAHCGGDIEIRNPTGTCDHLYYPDYCTICERRVKGERCPTCQGTGYLTPEKKP